MVDMFALRRYTNVITTVFPRTTYRASSIDPRSRLYSPDGALWDRRAIGSHPLLAAFEQLTNVAPEPAKIPRTGIEPVTTAYLYHE